MNRSDYRSAARAREAREISILVWLMISLGGAALIAAFLVLPGDAILELSRRARLPGHGDSSCAFCGMTRAALALAHGDAADALAINRGAAPLCACLVINTTLAALYCGRRLWETRRLESERARLASWFTRKGEEMRCKRSACCGAFSRSPGCWLVSFRALARSTGSTSRSPGSV